MRFLSPTAQSNLSPLTSGLPHPIRSAFRFSQPLDGFLLKLPGGLVSCLWHSRGSPCGAFPSKVAPRSRRVWFPFSGYVLKPPATAGVSTGGLLNSTRPKTRKTQRTHLEKGIDPPSSPFTSPLVLPTGGGRYSHGHRVPSRGYDQQTLLRRAILSCT